jgi:hypothetical protein
MARGSIIHEDLAELVRRTGQAASTFFIGDINTYFTAHADDCTLMKPFGREPAVASTL